MCRSPLHPFLAAVPKCEHHIHLEGSLEPSLLFSLASQNNISLPSSDTDPAFASPTALLARYSQFANLDDFLRYYYIAMSVLVHAADFEELAWQYFQHAQVDGVVHAEVFFDPQAHTGRGVGYSTIVEGFTRACERANRELGISTKLILCFLRHLPAKEAETTFEAARGDLLSGLLAGVGLDSSEVGFPAGLFAGVFEMAGKLGVRRTAHAGEEGGPDMVREAMECLGTERIDHGVGMRSDDSLIKEVAHRGLLVTVCPLSNVRLRVVKEVSELPIRKFLDMGVKFSINSDDPSYFGGYILDCYCAVQDAFGLSMEEWESIATNAIGGSWCGDKRKTEMLKMLKDVVRKHQKSR
ncbi:adenine deaminase [Trapelia coarctata]|nr:adenine deaminase [Trapelia coarctata]